MQDSEVIFDIRYDAHEFQLFQALGVVAVPDSTALASKHEHCVY